MSDVPAPPAAPTADPAVPAAPAPESPPAAPPAAAAPGTVTITQADLNARLAAARKDGEERATKRAPEPAKTPAEEVAAGLEEIRKERQRLTFERVAVRNGVPDAAHDDLFALYQAKAPTDGDAWIKDLRTRGLLPTAATSATVPAGAPVPGPASPAPRPVTSTVPEDGIVDITRLDDETLARLGPKGVVDTFKRTLMAARRASGAPPLPAVPRRNGA